MAGEGSEEHGLVVVLLFREIQLESKDADA